MAYILGDKTAYLLGKLTFNPIIHIDLLGTIVFPLILILFNSNIMLGWVKPMPINFFNLRHPKRDIFLISISGPLSNLIMIFIWASIAKITMISKYTIITIISFSGIKLNITLLVLNLLLLLPMSDGWYILSSILPKKFEILLKNYMLSPIILFIVLLFTMVTFDIIIHPIMQIILKYIFLLFELTPTF